MSVVDGVFDVADVVDVDLVVVDVEEEVVSVLLKFIAWEEACKVGVERSGSCHLKKCAR